MRLHAVLPGVTVGLVAILVTGGIWWGSADLVSGSTPQNRAARLVPADGTRVFSKEGDDVRTTESALLTGAQLVTSSPAGIGGAILLARQRSVRGLHIWRTTATSSSAVSGSPQTTTLRAVTDRGIEQLATYGRLTLVFTPALLEVPADVHAGSTWSSDGTARPDDSIRYRSTWAAAAVPGRDACVRIAGTIHFTDKAGTTLADSPSDETWCDGEGSAATTPAALRRASVVTGPTPTSSVTTADVAAWRNTLVPAATDDAFFGVEPYRARVEVTPVRLPDFTLVLPDASGNDLVGLTTPSTTFQKQWVGHPGGVITALGAVGSVSVVGTSERTISGYGPYGGWLWTRTFGDISATPPLDVGGGLVAVTTLDGHVEMLNAATGERIWAAAMPTEIRLPPVTDGRSLIIADQRGDLSAFDLRTGRRQWSRASEVIEAVGAWHGVVVTRSGIVARGWSAVDGTASWSIPIDGVGYEVLALGDVVVVATSDSTSGLDPATGALRWRTGGSTSSIALGESLFQIIGTQVRALDATGKVLAQWSPIGLEPRLAWHLVPTPTGVDVIDGNGTVVRLAP